MKKKIFLFSIFVLLSLALFSCGAMEKITQPTAKTDTGVPQQQQIPPYNGPKAMVAVASFDWKVGRTGSSTTTIRGVKDEPITITNEQSGIMSGLRDMLTTVLIQSGRYRVLERQQLSAIQEEIALTEKGYANKESGIKRGQIKGADLIITAAITGWDPGTSGTKAGIGLKIPDFITRIGGAFNKSSMAMDIRIIDTATSEVLSATRVEGEAKDVNLGGMAGIFIGQVGLSGNLGMYAKTPMEKAIRTCINEAVKYIASSTPPAYCKY